MHARLAAADPDGFDAVYGARGYRPLWLEGPRLRPEALSLVAMLRHAGDDGLDPQAYDAEGLAAAARDVGHDGPEQLARFELALSDAYGRYAADLRTPPPPAALLVTDPAAEPPRPTPRSALIAASIAPSLSRRLADLRPANPVYRGLRQALIDYRAHRAGFAGPDDYERRLRINLARARALPPDGDGRFVLVDAAAAQLWLYDAGRPRLTMPVAVGKLSEPTPLMAGVIRYAVFHPYWNVPPDLARERFAPQVLRQGPGYLASQHMEVLSDWSEAARVVDPASVDWAAVAAGQQLVRLRQRPGPGNMMGAVKLMLPNALGVYLHDTPDRSVFSHAERTFSAGCVRLSNAMALAKALGARPPPGEGQPEQRQALAQPVPVFIAYFTARPDGGRIALARDVYGRDAPLLAALDTRRIQLAAR